MINRHSVLAVAAACCVFFSIPCLAANDFDTTRKILETAEKYIPSGSKLIVFNKTAQESQLTYVNEDKMTYYDLWFDLATLHLEKVKAQSSNIIGSTMTGKTEADIKAIILAEYPQAKNIEVTTERDGVNAFYQAAFTTEDYAGVLKLNPVTGAIGERCFDYTGAVVTEPIDGAKQSQTF